MTRTIPTICACCGELFQARSITAAFCGQNCRRRAGYYRRSGRSIPVKATSWTQPIRPAAVQAEILDDPNDIPAAWLPLEPEPAPAAALEVREWNGTPIQRRDADGFVSATAMCQAGGKRLNHYLANERTQEYIRALAASVAGEKPCGAAVAGNPADLFQGSTGNPADLIRMVTTGPNEQRGTWIHPRLAVDLARWISPEFAVWMDGWFLEAMARPVLPQFTVRPVAPVTTLPKGVHVIAGTRREAAQLWWDAISGEVMGALARRLDPRHKTDSGLPLQVCYNWQPSLP